MKKEVTARKTSQAGVKKVKHAKRTLVKRKEDMAVEIAREDEFEAICAGDSEELKEINERMRELNSEFFRLHKLWFRTQKKGLHLPVEHLKASFKESEFTNFLGEIFGGVFCKTKAIEEKMDGIDRELKSIDEKIDEVNEEFEELKKRKKDILGSKNTDH